MYSLIYISISYYWLSQKYRLTVPKRGWDIHLGTNEQYLNAFERNFHNNDFSNVEVNIRTKERRRNEINYVTIPREIIYDKSLDDKRAIVYSYLCCRRALDDTVAFSVNELVKWTGLVPNCHDGKINHKYLDYLQSLSYRGYFERYPDFSNIKCQKGSSDYYYNAKLNIEKFDAPDGGFGIVYFDELQKILNFKEKLKDIKDKNGEKANIDTSRLSAAQILLLLSYIRVNIKKSNKQPQCCYRQYKTISEDIGLSERYISRIVEILDAMNIVKCKDGKRSRYIKKDGSYGYITAPKIFADFRKFIRDEYNNIKEDPNYCYEVEIQNQIEMLW